MFYFIFKNIIRTFLLTYYIGRYSKSKVHERISFLHNYTNSSSAHLTYTVCRLHVTHACKFFISTRGRMCKINCVTYHLKLRMSLWSIKFCNSAKKNIFIIVEFNFWQVLCLKMFRCTLFMLRVCVWQLYNKTAKRKHNSNKVRFLTLSSFNIIDNKIL